MAKNVVELDVNNDIVISNNTLAFANSAANEVKYKLQYKLQAATGECFLAPSLGVPYLTNVFIKNPNKALLDAAFADIIRGTPGVVSLDVLEFTQNKQTRRLSMRFSCTVESGETVTQTLEL